MNILLLINSFRLGGAEKVTYDLAMELNKYNDTNIYICSMGQVKSELEKNIVEFLSATNIQCLSVDKPRKAGRINAVFKINKIVRDYGIDIIHSNGQSPDFFSRIAKLMNSRLKVMITIHNTSGYSKLIEKLLGGLTSFYTAVSSEAEEYARNQLGIKKSILVVENGININKYSNINRNFSKPFSILTVARFNPQKAYVEALKLLSVFLLRHREVKWYIYGDYTECKEYFENFMDEVKRLNLEESIKIMGVSSDLEEIYGKGNCFFLGSSYEGFGIAFIEAMAAGLPVFGNKVGILGKIEEYGGKFFDIQKINVTETLEVIYSNSANEVLDINKNRQIVAELYGINVQAKKYHELYLNILENK